MEKNQKVKGNNIILYSLLWAVVYIICLIVIKNVDLSRTAGVMLSFIPTITFGLFIYNFIRKINSMDEVERRIQLEAIVWAFSLGLLLIMTRGLLDLVVIFGKGEWGYIDFIIPCFFAFYFLGILISRRKYLGR